MASLVHRVKSSIPLLNKAIRSEYFIQRSLLCPTFTDSELSRNYATATPPKEKKVKVPLALYGFAGNYATAFYRVAVRTNVLEKVELEFLDFVQATKNSPKFSQFIMDMSVNADTRMKVMTDICAHAKFSDLTKNLLLLMAENKRLGNIHSIADNFKELMMAHKGEVEATVTSVIPLPAQEEKELKEALQEVIGEGKTIILTQKIDRSILGGIIIEYSQKMLDMSIRTRARQMEMILREPVTLSDI